MRLIIVDYCPRCDSPRTGHFINGVPNREKVIKKFKNGERIKFFSITSNRHLNCFCNACGHKWHQDLKKTYLSAEDFNDYLHEYEFYEERNEVKKLSDEIMDNPQNKTLTTAEKEAKYKRTATVLAYTLGIDLRKFNPYTKKRIREELDEEDNKLEN